MADKQEYHEEFYQHLYDWRCGICGSRLVCVPDICKRDSFACPNICKRTLNRRVHEPTNLNAQAFQLLDGSTAQARSFWEGNGLITEIKGAREKIGDSKITRTLQDGTVMVLEVVGNGVTMKRIFEMVVSK